MEHFENVAAMTHLAAQFINHMTENLPKPIDFVQNWVLALLHEDLRENETICNENWRKIESAHRGSTPLEISRKSILGILKRNFVSQIEKQIWILYYFAEQNYRSYET